MFHLAAGWVHRLVQTRGWTVVVWLIVALVLGRFAMNVEEVLQVGATVPDSESDAARLAVDSLLPAGDAEYAVLVVRGIDPRETPEARERVDSLAARISSVSGVTRVRSYREPRDSLLVERWNAGVGRPGSGGWPQRPDDPHPAGGHG